MRKLNFTVQIPDNDLIQFNLEKLVYSIIGEEKVIDFRKFPNVEHLKDDETYKKLIKEKRKIGLEIDRYINNNRKK